ncbi:MAG TPA: hypothetical protein VMT09_02830 [Steroidobacteraceae bacterium]|nr:hypothetical protein [Steroidobacteraceae bacterium]
MSTATKEGGRLLTGKRISSRNTFFQKKVLPVLLFGVLALAVAAPIMLTRGRPNAPPWPIFTAPLAVAVIFYVLLRRLVFDLADEVVDEGDALRVRFGDEEERIPLAEIINLSYAGITNPPRITLTLRTAGRFGREVSFSPQQGFLSPLFRPNPLVNELIERVDAARRR